MFVNNLVQEKQSNFSNFFRTNISIDSYNLFFDKMVSDIGCCETLF